MSNLRLIEINFPQLTWSIKLQSLTPKPNLSMSHLLKLSSLNTSFTQLFVDAFIHSLIQQQIFIKHNKLPVLNVGCKSGCPCRRLVGCGSQHDHHCWRGWMMTVKGAWGTFRDVGNILLLDIAAGYIDVSRLENLWSYILRIGGLFCMYISMHVHITHKWYLIKAVNMHKTK